MSKVSNISSTINRVREPYHISELLGPAMERIAKLKATHDAKMANTVRNK